METITKLIIGGIALLHFYILYIEMFAWETKGKVAFKGALPDQLFAPTKVLAANQGLYNGFLGAGLIWTYFISDKNWSANIALFFLSCIAIAGIYGGITASKKIIFIQTIPAIIAIICVYFSY